MNAQTATQMIRFVELASAFAKRASDELQDRRKAAQAAAEKTAAVVDKMIATNAIKPHEKAAAAEMLQSHAGTLAILDHAVIKLASQEQTIKTAAELGSPAAADNSYDPASSLTSPFVGARRGSNTKSASDLALMRGLGLQA